jgi:hypothetical protein
MTLAATEFMRRFLLHVLPGGFHRIRHYGLLANGTRTASLARARQLLDAPAPPAPSVEDDPGTDAPPPRFICRHCGHPLLVVETLARGASIRAPPLAIAA